MNYEYFLSLATTNHSRSGSQWIESITSRKIFTQSGYTAWMRKLLHGQEENSLTQPRQQTKLRFEQGTLVVATFHYNGISIFFAGRGPWEQKIENLWSIAGYFFLFWWFWELRWIFTLRKTHHWRVPTVPLHCWPKNNLLTQRWCTLDYGLGTEWT